MKAGPGTVANGVAALAVPGRRSFSLAGAWVRARGVGGRGALGIWRRVVWCGSVLGARGGRGLPECLRFGREICAAVGTEAPLSHTSPP